MPNKKKATHQVEIDTLLLPCFRISLLLSRVLSSRVHEYCVLQDKNSAAILFPLPWAADNHQYFNAKFLEDKKASILLESSLDSADRLFTLLNDLEKDHNARHSMSLNAFDAFPISSGKRIVKIINESF